MEVYTQIGYTKKAHGTNGRIKINIEEQYLEDFVQADFVFLEINGQKMPYFIDDIQFGGALIVHFEDVESRETATLITSKAVFLREKDLIPEEEREYAIPPTTLEYAFIEGYTLIEETHGKIGVIEKIEAFPQQEMAFVQASDKVLMIPIAKEWLLNIARETQEIKMKLPEGLLGL